MSAAINIPVDDGSAAMLVRLKALEDQMQTKVGKEELENVKETLEVKFWNEETWKATAGKFMTDTKAATEAIYEGVLRVKGEMDQIVMHAKTEFDGNRNDNIRIKTALTDIETKMQEHEVKLVDMHKTMELIRQQWGTFASMPMMQKQILSVEEKMAQLQAKVGGIPDPATTATMPSASSGVTASLYEKFQATVAAEGAGVKQPEPQPQTPPVEPRFDAWAGAKIPQPPGVQGTVPWGGIDYSRMFDPKLAPAFAFDGRSKPDEWVKRTRNFFLGRCRPTEWMLEWAERKTDPITTGELLQEASRRGEQADAERISAEIWSFLNSCLQGDGQVTFGLVPAFNGVEAWRSVTRPVTSQSASRRVNLGNQVRNPDVMKTIADILPGLEKFEDKVKDYVMAGGTPPDDEEKCNIVMSKLPGSVQEKIMFSDFNSYANLKRYLQEHVQRAADLGMERHHAGHIHAVHAPPGTFAGNEDALNAIRELPDDASKDDIIAALRKGGGKGGRGGKGERRCFNCGDTGHIAANCTKTRQEVAECRDGAKGNGKGGKGVKRCYNCGKLGHIAANCRSGTAAALCEEDTPHYLFALENEGWQKTGVEARAKPKLIEFVPTAIANRFQQLGNDDGDSECMDSASLGSAGTGCACRRKTGKKRRRREAKRALCQAYNEVDDLMLLDEESEDLCTAEDYDYVMIEGILDSGSVTHVANPDDMLGYEVKESAGSRKGQVYSGAGGEKIKNLGEMDLRMLATNDHTKQEHEIRSTVQAAKVTKPLFSVGQICDKNIDVLFRKTHAVTIDAKTGKELTRHPRVNGTYRFRAKLKSPNNVNTGKKIGAMKSPSIIDSNVNSGFAGRG